jgi:multiple sugar transport system ATP-binding protein
VADARAVIVPGKLEVPLDGGAAAGRLPGSVMLGVRSEDIMVGPNETVEARVHGVENQGVEKVVTLRVDDCLLKATVPARLEIGIDALVRFSFKREKLHWFDAGSGLNLFYGEEGENG